MCVSETNDADITTKIRVSGLKGNIFMQKKYNKYFDTENYHCRDILNPNLVYKPFHVKWLIYN